MHGLWRPLAMQLGAAAKLAPRPPPPTATLHSRAAVFGDLGAADEVHLHLPLQRQDRQQVCSGAVLSHLAQQSAMSLATTKAAPGAMAPPGSAGGATQSASPALAIVTAHLLGPRPADQVQVCSADGLVALCVPSCKTVMANRACIPNMQLHGARPVGSQGHSLVHHQPATLAGACRLGVVS
jgi:hypothetical protein